MAAPRGKFIWYDVMTSDTQAATDFYRHVIGWDAQAHAMPDNRTYTVFSKGPAMVAGLIGLVKNGGENSRAKSEPTGWL
jgi:uncharacterized protein